LGKGQPPKVEAPWPEGYRAGWPGTVEDGRAGRSSTARAGNGSRSAHGSRPELRANRPPERVGKTRPPLGGQGSGSESDDRRSRVVSPIPPPHLPASIIQQLTD